MKPSGVFLTQKVFDMGLTPREFRVLAHIILMGECRCGVEKLALRCRVRHGDVLEILRILRSKCAIQQGNDAKGGFIRAITGLGERRSE